METVLCSLSQLTKLTLYGNGSRGSLLDGEMWEKLIQSSLPLLKTFQFCFSFYRYSVPFNDINQVVVPFSTPFYLLEKRWFIRCYTDSHCPTTGTIYTLPFAFAQMPINMASFDASISTLIVDDIDERRYESYGKVKTLLFNVKCQMPYRAFLTSNIVRLVLHTALPSSWHFLLNNLRHLEFQRTSEMSSADFGQFLTNTPVLQSLTLPIRILSNLTENFTNNAVCDLLSNRIQSLTISQYFSNGNNLGIVTVHNLSSLVRIFGKTCKHLALGLSAHPNTALTTLRRMRGLHSLHIYYCSRCYRSQNTVTCWMEEMRKKADVSDFMHTSDDHNFYIWFGNRL
jgi:hypothetical protein